MAKSQDYTKVIQDLVSNFPVDTSSYQDAFKNSAAMSEKVTKLALEAAEQSTEISSKWTRETLARVGELARTKDEPAEYAKALSDFTSATAELAAENLAAFAEVAKKMQMETVELILAAGKDMSDEATATAKKAADSATGAAKKAIK